MKIDIKIDSTCKEPKIVIHTAEMTEEVDSIVRQLSPQIQENIVGFQNELATILAPENIIRLYAEKQKNYAETSSDIFLIRQRLYEAELILNNYNFVRISHSEIVNLRMVDNMDLSLTGTICMKLQNGKTVFVSRRYVPKIKEKLGL